MMQYNASHILCQTVPCHTLQRIYISFVTLNLQMFLDHLQLTVNLGEHLLLQ